MKNAKQETMDNRIIRVIVDTNLWISFLIGKRLNCLLELLDNPWFTLVSTPILNEKISRVVRRPKLKHYFPEESVLQLEKWMEKNAEMHELDTITPRCRGPKDDYLLELAIKSKATFLVSSDKDLLEIGQVDGCRIMTFTEFEAEWS